MLSFLVGTTVLAVFLGLAAYAATLMILRLYHRRHPRIAIRAATRRSASAGRSKIESGD
jgi:hypothetical protein